MLFYLSYATIVIANNDNVIDIYNQIDTALWRMIVKYRVISFTLNHTKLLNHDGEYVKLSSRRMLKTIKRFTKMTNKTKTLPLSNKSRRLLHIDLFFEITMEEGILDVQLMSILDVQLMKWPMPHSSHRQKETNNPSLPAHDPPSPLTSLHSHQSRFSH